MKRQGTWEESPPAPRMKRHEQSDFLRREHARGRRPIGTYRLRLWALTTIVSALSCAPAVRGPAMQVPPEQDGPAAVVSGVRDLGALRFLGVIRGRDIGFSARFRNRSVWVFGDTPLNYPGADGSSWRSSTWCWTRDFDARDGLSDLNEPLDSNDTPGEFLPFTKEEQEYNAVHNRDTLPADERSRWGLWPGPLAVDPATGKAIVFYSKVFSKVGPWAFEDVGHSIAVWDDPAHRPVRPQVRPDAEEPTLLFPKGDFPTIGGAVCADGWIYAYGCRREGVGFDCILARVTFADALTRSAWRFFTGDGRWSDDWHDAVPVMKGAPMLSVHWNRHLRRYLAVYSTPLTNTIEIRTAEQPEGPWSASRVVATGRAPIDKETWDYCGMAHAELARGNGRVEYITYLRGTGFLSSEMRLVEVTFK